MKGKEKRDIVKEAIEQMKVLELTERFERKAQGKVDGRKVELQTSKRTGLPTTTPLNQNWVVAARTGRATEVVCFGTINDADRYFDTIADKHGLKRSDRKE